MVILSGEAMAEYFWRPLPAFLSRLDELAGRHRVRVAYYVRPQHTALEAGWRQWGFRSGLVPSHFIESFSGAFRYVDTYLLVCRNAMFRRKVVPAQSHRPRGTAVLAALAPQ